MAKPSTWAWIVVHLVYPLLPVALEGVIRLVATDWQPALNTFSAGTLAMSAGIISVFVNQSIRVQQVPLADETENDSRNLACAWFLIAAITSFALFAVVILLHTLINDRQVLMAASILHGFQILIFVLWVIPVISAVVAQRSFKLRASLI